MQEAEKESLLQTVRAHIDAIRARIKEAVPVLEHKATQMSKEGIRMSAADAITQRMLVAHRQEKIEQLKQLYPSPYFTKCIFEVGREKKEMYFGKFSFSEEGIYSWVTPAATLRFENPGEASYVRPDGSEQSGVLLSKDQYMIVDGKLLFFATESIGKGRELVYQEHFTRRKQGFVLPEVVEQMERAQDRVVRADHRGPFVISGPAGSGKTTLALHRVAYLSESPETAEYFKPDGILVLVQDNGTRDYFSHLLPELGIHGVAISTFADWAFRLLGLEGVVFVRDHGCEEGAQFAYEFAKLRFLRGGMIPQYSKHVFSILEKSYASCFSADDMRIWRQQKKEKKLDRFDVTVLLMSIKQTRGMFIEEREYYEELANGSYRKKKSNFQITYNLAVIDEFQNYLPEQLKIIQDCINHRLDSVVYVGDLAQQTQLGTIRAWEEVGQTFSKDRLVVLEKVYRNTKQILRYVQSLGYVVTIPDQLKEGEPVREIVLTSFEEECAYVAQAVRALAGQIIGVLSKDAAYAQKFASLIPGDDSRLFCLSFQESQGVEFDVVFIVGVSANMFDAKAGHEYEAQQIAKIKKDLLYVALTRAMSSMHILGTSSLKEAVQKLTVQN